MKSVLAQSSAPLVTMTHEVFTKLFNYIGSLLWSRWFFVDCDNNRCNTKSHVSNIQMLACVLRVTFLRLHAVESALVLLGSENPVSAGEEDEPCPSKGDAICLEVLGG